MTDLTISREARRLTEQEKEQFQQWGYVKNLPVFDPAALPRLQEGFREMVALLPPAKTVSVWLALFDTEEENGAMRIVRGSHRWGNLQHRTTVDGDQYVLSLEVEQDAIKPEEEVTMDLKAGEISLHDNRLIHGSGPNNSDRIRAGQTMRFSPTEVKCDLSVWPTFESYLVRGVDEYQHNPVGKVPAGNGNPVCAAQGSWEFA